MRIAILFTAVILLGSLQPTGYTSNIKPLHEVSRTSPDLEIHSARLKGRKLIVSGMNFDEGAVVLVNGQLMKTIRDSDSSTTRLVAKKAGDAIPLDTIYKVTVKNSNDEVFLKNFRGSLFNARVLPTWQESGAVGAVALVYVHVGDYLLTTLPEGVFELATFINIDANYLERVTDIALPSSEYRLYRAIQNGFTRFEVVWYTGGEYPPQWFYGVTITIG